MGENCGADTAKWGGTSRPEHKGCRGGLAIKVALAITDYKKGLKTKWGEHRYREGTQSTALTKSKKI